MAIDLLKYMIWKNGTGGGGASYEKTVGPAPIISISDAKPKPAKSLIVGMEPIQDLHGYDSPWPAGGGKNKIIPLTATKTNNSVSIVCSAESETITLTGTAQSSGGRTNKLTQDVVLPAGNYVLSITGEHSGDYILNKTSDNSYLSASAFSLAEETSVYLGVNVSNGTTYNETVKIQVEQGSTPTAWTPYSNICPISGRTGVTVTRTGKNLFNADSIVDEYIVKNSDGSLSVSRNNRIYEKKAWENVSGYNGQITLTYIYKYASTGTAGAYPRILYTDGTFSLMPVTVQTSFATVTLTSTSGKTVDYVDFTYATGGNATTFFLQIEFGPTATDYEPYTGATYPVTWQTEAGTVYGGTVDLVTGVLTVDRVIDTITKDSTWYGFNTGTGNSSAVVQLSNYLNVKYVDGASSFNGAISSTGREAQNYWTGGRENEIPNYGDMCFAYSQTGQLRFHRLDVANITDLASFKANFPDTTICYYLATPQTYQLTPQQIQMLKGANVLWSDADELTLTYLAKKETQSLGNSAPLLFGGLNLGNALNDTNQETPQETVVDSVDGDPSEEE